MKKVLFFAFFCILSILFIQCEKEDDASPVVILFEDASHYQSASAGDIIKLKIKSFTSNKTIDQFKIHSFDSEKGDISLLDTTPATKEFIFDFLYTVPSFNTDSVKHQLIFQSIDNLGKYNETVLRLTIKGGSLNLEEKSGLMLYAGNSGKEDGFSLSAPSQTFICSLNDSALIDIYAYSDPDDKTEQLSGEWRTNTDVEFIKNNTFDYVNATSTSIENIYRSSLRSNHVKDLKRGDIIIVGKKNLAWGIIHIVAIYDEKGIHNDGYLMNYKTIK